MVTALPVRSSRRVSIWMFNTLRDQPYSMAARAYARRSVDAFRRSSNTRLWPQGNCAATCCTISASGQASANARMYLRLRGEKPFISGKAVRRSFANRSITLAPQPCSACRASMLRRWRSAGSHSCWRFLTRDIPGLCRFHGEPITGDGCNLVRDPASVGPGLSVVRRALCAEVLAPQRSARGCRQDLITNGRDL